MLEICHTPGRLEAGCDEAGRGCIAGPVYAAAVILQPDFKHPLLNDSKKLSRKTRDKLRLIIEKEALSYGIGVVDHLEIDAINILNASFLAMHRAIDQLDPRPEFLLVDGNRFKTYGETPHACIIKGDGIYASIAAASVLAKTHRDQYMESIHQAQPHYGWNRNKGYPTREHRRAIMAHGPSEHHRRSFRLLGEQLSLFE